MMPIKKKRDIEAGLLNKGFRKVETDHSVFIYHTQENLKSCVRTKFSHGSKNQDIPVNLFSAMASQCKLTNRQFTDLIECPLSRVDYELLLHERDLL
jgi:hypothetical protein